MESMNRPRPNSDGSADVICQKVLIPGQAEATTQSHRRFRKFEMIDLLYNIGVAE
jgi:hypothetical protein